MRFRLQPPNFMNLKKKNIVSDSLRLIVLVTFTSNYYHIKVQIKKLKHLIKHYFLKKVGMLYCKVRAGAESIFLAGAGAA
jgi:hypothetical protein